MQIVKKETKRNSEATKTTEKDKDKEKRKETELRIQKDLPLVSERERGSKQQEINGSKWE